MKNAGGATEEGAENGGNGECAALCDSNRLLASLLWKAARLSASRRPCYSTVLVLGVVLLEFARGGTHWDSSCLAWRYR